MFLAPSMGRLWEEHQEPYVNSEETEAQRHL